MNYPASEKQFSVSPTGVYIGVLQHLPCNVWFNYLHICVFQGMPKGHNGASFCTLSAQDSAQPIVDAG